MRSKKKATWSALALGGILLMSGMLSGCGSAGAILAGAAINAAPAILGRTMFSEDESEPYPTDDLVDAAEATLRKAMRELPDDESLRIAVIPILNADQESLTVIGNDQWWQSEVEDLMARSCASDIWINPQFLATKLQQQNLRTEDLVLTENRYRLAESLASEGQPIGGFLIVHLRINAQRQAPGQKVREVRATFDFGLQQVGASSPTQLATRNYDTEAGTAWWRDSLQMNAAETTASK